MKPMTPRTLAWIDEAPTTVSQTRRIAATPDAVWAHVADHAAWPTWFPGIKKVVPGSTADAVDGTRTVHLTGMAVEERFLAWEPGVQFAFTGVGATRKALKSLVENIELTPDGDDATTVTYSIALEAGLPLLGKIVGAGMKQASGKALAELAKRANPAE